jgi:hypothetical protein
MVIPAAILALMIMLTNVKNVTRLENTIELGTERGRERLEESIISLKSKLAQKIAHRHARSS